MNKRIVYGTLLATALFLAPGMSRARLYNVNTGRFQTMDVFEGDQSAPQSLHKYVYAEDNPVNRVDPNGQQDTMIELAFDEGFSVLAQMPNLVSVGEAIAPLSSGFWVVTKKDVDLSDADTFKGASPHGFMVFYHLGAVPPSTLVIYQTITPPLFAPEDYPHVDNTPPPHQATAEIPLPPAMTPRGSLPNSYVDTPTWGHAVPPGTFKITAVAASRLNNHDTILGHHYFEWSNRSRTISNESDSYSKQWQDSMAHWNRVPGY